MQKYPSAPKRSRPEGFDGKRAAHLLYGGPPEATPSAKTEPPRGEAGEYNDLFGPPALSAESRREPKTDEDPERVPFDPQVSFHDLRRRCVAAGERYGDPYDRLLSSLRGPSFACEPLARHEAEERRGASYKRLCAAAHLAGFSTPERKNLYWIAEQVGMSDRFAGHIIASLKRNDGGQR